MASEISEVLSALGFPAVAVALAVGLVRGAGALEKDASEPALWSGVAGTWEANDFGHAKRP